jgi:hypothetical protein
MKNSHVFWGSLSPLAGLGGGGLLVMGSVRLAYALIAAGALFWVYGFSVLVVSSAKRILPDRGRTALLTTLSAFLGGVYLLLWWFICPVAAMEVFFLVSLVPLICAGSGIFSRVESLDIPDALARALSEAAVLGGLLTLLSLIREPLGFGSLSLPGGAQGMVPLFALKGESVTTVRVVAGSAGALLLLGYGAALYRYFRKIHAPREDEL